MTRKKVGTDNGKGKEEKRFEKFDVLDENNHDNEEKDDEFIVKMILKPLSSNDGTNLTNNLTDKPSKFSKILKKSKNRRNEETVTLTQMVKKSSKSNEASGEIILDEESSSSDSSESSNDETETVTKTLKNTNLFLSAYGGGPRQKTSLIKLLHDVKPKYVILYDSELW